MPEVVQVLPEVSPEEQAFISGLIRGMTDEQARTFAVSYRSQRKDPNSIMLVTLVGFIGVAGIQRFMLDQIGMGLLYLVTGGVCAVGTIIDLVNYKKLTFEYNQNKAQQIAAMLTGRGQGPRVQVVQAAAVQAAAFCMHCGAKLAPEARFCLRCGGPVQDVEPLAAATCATCKCAMPTGAAFCPGCGSKVETANPAPAALAGPLPACLECGAPLPEGSVLCAVCGTRAEGSASPETPPTP